MGKFFALVKSTTPVETRTKKDGSGTYQYADATLQLYDKDALPSINKIFDRWSGESLGEEPDLIVYNAFYEKALALDEMRLQPNEIVIVDLSVFQNKFGNNEIKVLKIERQQPQGPQRVQR